MAKDVEITGVKELDRKLSELGPAMRKKPLRKATRAAAKLTLRQAKNEAPHDTGELEKSLRVKAARRTRKTLVKTNVETKEGLFKGDQFYAGMVEFGTKQRQTRRGWNRGAIAKKQFSFLRPALYFQIERKRRIFIVEVLRWMRTLRPRGPVRNAPVETEIR